MPPQPSEMKLIQKQVDSRNSETSPPLLLWHLLCDQGINFWTGKGLV